MSDHTIAESFAILLNGSTDVLRALASLPRVDVDVYLLDDCVQVVFSDGSSWNRSGRHVWTEAPLSVS